MIWRLLICFSAATAPVASGQEVAGRIILADSNDERVVRRQDHSGVVVWLTPVKGVPLPAPPAKPAVMAQKNKTFQPHVLAIQAGTTVDFPNYDPIFHNAFSTYDGRVFDLGLYPPGTSRRVLFDRPGIVRVFCNIHEAMSAIIAVLPGPWFCVTPRSGAVSIPAVPEGEYMVHFFHERALPEVLEKLSRKITVGPKGEALGPITISEAGYLPMPRKNKYGLDYVPDLQDRRGYPPRGRH
jgi:plastocyanin